MDVTAVSADRSDVLGVGAGLTVPGKVLEAPVALRGRGPTVGTAFPEMGPPVLTGGRWTRGTVVVVDDVASVRAALVKTLEARGYRTIALSGLDDGMKWLEQMGQRVAAEEGGRDGGVGEGLEGGVPGVVLIDVHLADGSGLELAARAREVLGRRSVVAVVSGDTSIDNLRQLAATGADLFLAKPVHVPTLLEQIQGWMARVR